MIIDHVRNLARYQRISPRLERVSRFLRDTDLKNLPLGRTDIEGDLLYVNHMAYATAARTGQELYEDHRRYWDLHFVLSGREAIAVAPSGALTQVKLCEAEDFALYQGGTGMELPLGEGEFLLLYPGEGHLPKLSSGGETAQVDKLVFKIDAGS